VDVEVVFRHSTQALGDHHPTARRVRMRSQL
jgi:hypothetical protein